MQPSESDSADTTVLLVTLVPLLLVLGEADPLLAAYTDLHRLFDLVLKKKRERERERENVSEENGGDRRRGKD